MHTNAIESWLARMYRHAIRTGEPVNWWFHVQLEEPGRLETTHPECASRIIRSPYTLSEGTKFFREFYRLCRRMRFDVIHVHADVMSAPFLTAARLAGHPRMIVHVHNADENIPTSSRLKAALFRPLFRGICFALADRIVGISNHTLDTFLHGRRRRQGRDVVHYYGIDPMPFIEMQIDRTGFRRELGFPDSARILLFAGRMAPEKNPLFALEVLAEMRRIDPNVVGVFAGAGGLEAQLREQASVLNMESGFRFLGWRTDVADIMHCSDWFILPRPELPMEGFGIAVVEAQLAGLRLLLSRGIADDPLLPTAVYRRLPLDAGAAAWARAACELWNAPAPSKAAALAALRASPMDMDRALDALLGLYA
jgi:glycosyltransferase involved in cell wall biosynthesis